MTASDEYQTICPKCSGPLYITSLFADVNIPLKKDGYDVAHSRTFSSSNEVVVCRWCKYLLEGIPMGPWDLTASVSLYKDNHWKLVLIAKCQGNEGPVAMYDINGEMTLNMIKKTARFIAQEHGRIIEADRVTVKVVNHVPDKPGVSFT
jgi:hypothetical protein